MIHFNKKNLDQEHLFCFLHIPKTGGRTLWKLLEDQEKDIIVRHGTLFEKFGKPTTYLTMLRDPVDRVISTYFYIQNYRRDPLHKKVKKMSLREFVGYMKNKKIGDRIFPRKDPRSIRYRTVNLATRYLSGGDPQDLDKAFKHLKEEFSVIGVTDLYDESLFFIKKELDWFKVNKMKKVNVTSKRLKVSEVPKDLIKEIKKLNQKDIELYNWARSELQKKINNLDAADRKVLNNFKKSIYS